MKEDVSAGAIVFRHTKDDREFLLLRSRTTDWEFPKGGIEGDEELQQAALREIEEETGLSDLEIKDGFSKTYSYIFEAQGDKIDKTVYLYIVETFDTDVSLSKEHYDYQWRSYEEALNTVTHSGPSQILREAKEYLDKEH